ncbi:MAG TPA: glycosyltransferase family 39 protein [Patescibacteria group bacterium]
MKKNSMLWLILVFALLLRLPLLNGSFWLDEAAQALESVRPLSQQLNIIPDFQPPLLHYIVHFAAQVSISEWWLRLWGALIPGLVTIWATFKLGEKLFNRQVAVVASLLLATSSFHVFYSQELRPYSLPAMWAILSTLLIFKKDFSWWRFTLVTLLGFYSSYLYPFFFIAQLWLIAKQKGGFGHVVKIITVMVVLFAPWLPMFWRQLQAGQALRVTFPNWETAVSLPQAKALVLVPLKFVYGLLNLEPNFWFIGSFLVLASSLYLVWRTHQITKKELNLLVLTIAPLLVAWLISFVVPVVQPKRLLFLLPLFYLLVSVPLSTKKIPTRVALLPISLMLIINLISVWRYWVDPQLQRENWRSLKQEVLHKFPADDTVAVFVFNEALSPWRWYQPSAMTSLSLSPSFMSNTNNLHAQLRPITNYQYVLVFDYLRDLTDPTNALEPAVESLGFTGRGVIDYPNIGFVRIYSQSNFALGWKP